jgi:hypothetical protein
LRYGLISRSFRGPGDNLHWRLALNSTGLIAHSLTAFGLYLLDLNPRISV